MKKAMILMVLVLAIPACAGVSWTNVVGGSNVTNTGGVLTWGTYPQSGLTFAENPIAEGVFQLGTLTHTNKPIAVGSAITSATLRLDILGNTWLCPMLIDETLNLRPLSDDKIAWDAPEWSYGGLTILGFGTSPDSLVDYIWTPECVSQSIALWATYCPETPSVPVPGGLLLASIGCLGLGLRRAA